MRPSSVLPAVDVRDQPLDGVEVRRKQALRVGRRNLADAREGDDVRHASWRRQLETPFDCARSGCRVVAGGTAVEPARRSSTSAANARRRSHDEHRQRVAAPARLEIALAQVQQVARAPAPRRRGAGRRRRPSAPRTDWLPETTTWSARIAPNSNGNASSERPNSCAARSSGVARPASCHAATRAGARAQVVGRQRVDDRQRVHRRCVVIVPHAMSSVRPSAGRRSVDHERLQPAAEDPAEVALERRATASGMCMTHCIECGRCVCAS